MLRDFFGVCLCFVFALLCFALLQAIKAEKANTVLCDADESVVYSKKEERQLEVKLDGKWIEENTPWASLRETDGPAFGIFAT